MDVRDSKAANEFVKSFEKNRVESIPPTHKSVLLNTWAQDTKKMASETIGSFYNDYFRRYELPDGVNIYDVDEAIKHYIAYLNSAAEVGK